MRRVSQALVFFMVMSMSGIASFAADMPAAAKAPKAVEAPKADPSDGYPLLPYLSGMDDFGDEIVDPFNENGYLGELHGKIRSFTLWQNSDSQDSQGAISNADATSSSLGFYIDYKTPEFMGLSGAFQWVDVLLVGQGEHGRQFPDFWYNQNGRYNVFNELYLNYNFRELGLEKTEVRVGRQIRHLDYFKKFGLRQKDQSMRAVVLTSRDIPDTSVMIGHMDRFSSWSGRNVVPFDPSFRNLGDVMRVPYRTSGATFGTATYKGVKDLSVTLYDWALWDLVNVLGGKAAYTVKLSDDFKIVPGAHYAWQRDIGRMEKEGLGKVTSWIMEITLPIHYRKWFMIEPGYAWVMPNETGETNNFLQPFDTLFVCDREKGGPYTRPLNAGAQTFTLKNILKWKKTKLISTWYYTIHPNDTVNSATDRGTVDNQIETDLIQPLTKRLSTKLTGVWGMRGTNVPGRKDMEKWELRMMFEYKF